MSNTFFLGVAKPPLSCRPADTHVFPLDQGFASCGTRTASSMYESLPDGTQVPPGIFTPHIHQLVEGKQQQKSD